MTCDEKFAYNDTKNICDECDESLKKLCKTLHEKTGDDNSCSCKECQDIEGLKLVGDVCLFELGI